MSFSVGCVYFHHSENDMRFAMQQPWVSFGSDGAALRAEGRFPRGSRTRALMALSRASWAATSANEKVITLEEAVRKATSHNAAKVRLFDRGLLRPGMWADVTVFNPDTIIDRATYDNPHQYSVGVEYVIVNGRLVVDRGKHTGARPGTVLYGPGRRG